jgi:hypothetical protein
MRNSLVSKIIDFVRDPMHPPLRNVLFFLVLGEIDYFVVAQDIG